MKDEILDLRESNKKEGLISEDLGVLREKADKLFMVAYYVCYRCSRVVSTNHDKCPKCGSREMILTPMEQEQDKAILDDIKKGEI